MRFFTDPYRRFSLLARKLWFKVALSIFVIAVGGGAFGTLLAKSYDLRAQRVAIATALEDQNHVRGDIHAVSLLEDGEVTVNGRTYGGEEFRGRASQFFLENGAIASPISVAYELVADQEPKWAPAFLIEHPGTAWLVTLVSLSWFLLIIWIELTAAFLVTSLTTGLLVWAPGLLAQILPGWLGWLINALEAYDGAEQLRLAFAGMGLLTFTFVLLTRTAELLFSYPSQLLSVARTVIKEATRTRLPLVFVIILLVGLPLLPLSLDPDAALRFRLQTFISRSVGLTYVLAACMTLFMACASVSFEIRDRQIWHLMTKPLSRFNYLLGKWIGMATLNLMILVIAGISIFMYVQYMRELPVASGLAGVEDRYTVDHEILSARVGQLPEYDHLEPQRLRELVDERIDSNEDYRRQADDSRLRKALAHEIRQEHESQQRSVPNAHNRPGNERTYVFTDLQDAKKRQPTVSLRYRFHIMRDDEHERFSAIFYFNGDQQTYIQRDYTPTVTHVLRISRDYIQDDGTLAVTVVNPFFPPQAQRHLGSLNFDEEDFELLYEVSSFEGNFMRGVAILWIKLSFLTMLGLACATALNFSVACLLSFTVFLALSIAPFLAISLNEYYPPHSSQVDWSDLGMVISWVFKSVIRAIAVSLVFMVGGMGEYRPTQLLVEGRLIPWLAVFGSILRGLIWSGLSLLIGYLVLRNRQLAIYSGHG